MALDLFLKSFIHLALLLAIFICKRGPTICRLLLPSDARGLVYHQCIKLGRHCTQTCRYCLINDWALGSFMRPSIYKRGWLVAT